MYTQHNRGYMRSSNGFRSNSFRRPQRSGNYSNRFSSRGGNKKKTLSNDPYQFIKKAVETVESNYLPKNSFQDFNLATMLIQNIDYKGYKTPTPIQDQAILPILEGRDLIGLAQTGTGKTAAFLIPLINKLYKRDSKALIIVPTRELALQIQQEFKNLSYDMKLYSAVLIGGSNMLRQIHEVRRNPHLVIATPGRLKDLIERKVVKLEEYSTIVLDEVDLMVDIGFITDIKYFVSLMPRVRQSLFFSATISPKIEVILKSFVTDPVTVSIVKSEKSENIDQDVVKVTDRSKKVDILHDLLIKDGFEKVLIFGNTKHGVEKLSNELNTRGFKTGAIHGNKRQTQRQRTLESFRRNEIQILLATDVASRGLDIRDVTHVINYELPASFEEYTHRIGRTGRAGNKGVALTFIE